MTPKQMVLKIYKTAYCSPFRSNMNYPEHNFIVRYYPCKKGLCRPESVGLGATRKAAWKDAADSIGQELLEKFQL